MEVFQNGLAFYCVRFSGQRKSERIERIIFTEKFHMICEMGQGILGLGSICPISKGLSTGDPNFSISCSTYMTLLEGILILWRRHPHGWLSWNSKTSITEAFGIWIILARSRIICQVTCHIWMPVLTMRSCWSWRCTWNKHKQ